MYGSPTYESEKKNELSFNECTEVLDDFVKTSEKLNATPVINFSGGDPLLRHDFFDLLKECKNRNIQSGILGNPYLINKKTAKELKKLGIKDYQISIDGMEKTHDFFRKKNSFKDSIRAFKILKENQIKTVCMFTLSKQNAQDLIPLIQYIKNKVDIFDFSRLVPTGNGKQLRGQLFKPLEYRNFLLNVLEEYRKLEGKTTTIFGRKDHLWTLLYHELGLFYPKKTGLIEAGCSMGIKHLSILSDGQVMACRRLPLVIGKVPEESLLEIFLNSKKLNEIRQVEKMEKCGNCNLLDYCRGCPAVAYAISGSYYSPDPQCWKAIE